MNKKILIKALTVIMTFALITVSFPINAKALVKAPTDLHSHHAFVVIDYYSGKVLMGQDYTKKVYPASTTKIATAMACINKIEKSPKLSYKKKIKIKRSVLKKVDPSLYQLHLKAGQTYTIDALLNMALISSAGDATYILAEAVFGSPKKCVKAMNKIVKNLKLKSTHFDNVVGLDISDGYNYNYSTAKDVALLTQYAMNNKKFASIVKKKTYAIYQTNGAFFIQINNTNTLMRNYNGNDFTVLGTKTGSTTHAGNVLSSTIKDKNGHKLICVYMSKNLSIIRDYDITSVYKKTLSAVAKKKLWLRTKNKYPVFFKAMLKDSGEIAPKYFSFDKKNKLPTNGFVLDGYHIVSWNTKKDGTGDSYDAGSSVKNLISRKQHSITLYAQWEKDAIKISEEETTAEIETTEETTIEETTIEETTRVID